VRCDTCDTEYLIETNGSEIARTLCRCEAKKKCDRKKCKAPAVQAELAADYAEVLAYLCRGHCYEELLHAEVAPPAPSTPTPAEPRGMQYEEHGWIASKEAVLAEVRKNTHKVKCTGCGDAHTYNKRAVDGADKHWKVLCPKCKFPGYLLVE
jgi:hypothetical protein